MLAFINLGIWEIIGIFFVGVLLLAPPIVAIILLLLVLKNKSAQSTPQGYAPPPGPARDNPVPQSEAPGN